jgi:folylpolyglutamate synthase/dihydropteroate synthase
VVIYPHTTYLGDVTTTIAQEKYGFLKLKSKPVVNVSFSNPNVRVVNMQNVVVKQPKPKRLAWLISGIAVGITGGILLMAN